MPQHHPDYLLLKERSPKLAFLWRVGRAGCTLGRIGAMAAPIAVVTAAVLHQPDPQSPTRWWPVLLTAAISFSAFAAVVVLSVLLKNYVRKRGAADDFSGNGR